MGAKTWMLVYTDGDAREILKSNPRLDRVETMRLAQMLFPSERLQLLGDGDLSVTSPPDDELYIGCFSGLNVVAAKEFGIDYPSKLSSKFLSNTQGQTVYLHVMHSAVDWFAFAKWNNGELQRSLSLSPDFSVMENIGLRLPFEEPYWSGNYPVYESDSEEESDYPFPFHPLELGEAALYEFFGYQIEGNVDFMLFDPETVPLMRFRRSRHWWKFW